MPTATPASGTKRLISQEKLNGKMEDLNISIGSFGPGIGGDADSEEEEEEVKAPEVQRAEPRFNSPLLKQVTPKLEFHSPIKQDRPALLRYSQDAATRSPTFAPALHETSSDDIRLGVFVYCKNKQWDHYNSSTTNPRYWVGRVAEIVRGGLLRIHWHKVCLAVAVV